MNKVASKFHIFKQVGLQIYNLVITVVLFFIYFSSAKASEDWLSDEVLKQLQEIRRDLNSIKQDVQQLDEGRYVRCLDDSAEAKKVDSDMAYGNEIGVSGTPAFYIGKIEGEQIVEVKHVQGAQPYANF